MLGDGLWMLGDEFWMLGDELGMLGDEFGMLGDELWMLGDELWMLGDELWMLGDACAYVWAPPGGTQMTPRCSKRVPEHGTGPSRAFSGGAGRAFEIAGHAAHCSVRRRACGGRHGALGGRARQHRRRPRRRTGPRPPRQSVSLGVKFLVEPWCNSAFPRTAHVHTCGRPRGEPK